MGYFSILLLLVSLLGILGLVGISLIFFWKKVGFYLVAGEVILTIVLSLVFGLGPNAFASLVSITILYIYLNRSGVWEKMS